MDPDLDLDKDYYGDLGLADRSYRSTQGEITTKIAAARKAYADYLYVASNVGLEVNPTLEAELKASVTKSETAYEFLSDPYKKNLYDQKLQDDYLMKGLAFLDESQSVSEGKDKGKDKGKVKKKKDKQAKQQQTTEVKKEVVVARNTVARNPAQGKPELKGKPNPKGKYEKEIDWDHSGQKNLLLDGLLSDLSDDMRNIVELNEFFHNMDTTRLEFGKHGSNPDNLKALNRSLESVTKAFKGISKDIEFLKDVFSSADLLRGDLNKRAELSDNLDYQSGTIFFLR